MAKALYCRDMGADCDFVARGENEEKLFKNAGEHAAEVHDMTSVSPEMIEMAKTFIREE